MPPDDRDTLYAVLLTWPLCDDEHEPTNGSLVVEVRRFDTTAERDAFVQGVLAVCRTLPEDTYDDLGRRQRQPSAVQGELLRVGAEHYPGVAEWREALKALDAAQAGEVDDAR